jgi:hypothetical protein
MFSKIYPKKDFEPNWFWPLVIAAIWCYLLLPEKSKKNTFLSFVTIKNMLNCLVMYFALIFLSFVFMNNVIPSAYTTFTGTEFNALTQVTKKIKQNPILRGCSYRIYTELFNGKLCTSEPFYDSVNVGDKIVLNGIQSRYDFKIYSTSLVARVGRTRLQSAE